MICGDLYAHHSFTKNQHLSNLFFFPGSAAGAAALKYIYISTNTYYTCTGTTKRHVCTVRGSLGEANGRIDEGIAKKQGSKCNGICGLEMNQSFKKESIRKHESAKESKIT
jgi:hypothetical protein